MMTKTTPRTWLKKGVFTSSLMAYYLTWNELISISSPSPSNKEALWWDVAFSISTAIISLYSQQGTPSWLGSSVVRALSSSSYRSSSSMSMSASTLSEFSTLKSSNAAVHGFINSDSCASIYLGARAVWYDDSLDASGRLIRRSESGVLWIMIKLGRIESLKDISNFFALRGIRKPKYLGQETNLGQNGYTNYFYLEIACTRP